MRKWNEAVSGDVQTGH